MLDLLQSPTAAAIDALHAATAIYTRSHVVADLMDRTGWPEQPGILADTSAGDGAFLVEAIRRLDPAPGDTASAARIIAWELHPGACRSARIAVQEELEAHGWESGEARSAASAMVREADFIADGPPPGTIRHLVGNPPYLRWSGIPEPLRSLYRQAVGKHAQGDILHAFLDACDRALTDDGTIAMVTADRWLTNHGTADLRELIGRRNGIAHLERLDPGTSFYRPKFRQAGSPPRIHPVALVMRRQSDGLARLDRSPTYPRHGFEPERTATPTVPLRSIATVTLGPWVGPDGIFLVTAAQAAASGLDPRELVAATDTDDLPPDRDGLGPTRKWVIATDRRTRPSTAVMAHLERTMAAMPPRGRKDGKGAWWTPPERLPPTLDRPAIIVPRIANRLRAVPVEAGITPVNHNFHVVSAHEGIGRDRLIEILRDPRVQAEVQATAPPLENGYKDIRTHYLRNLAIPADLLPPG